MQEQLNIYAVIILNCVRENPKGDNYMGKIMQLYVTVLILL